jgi:Zn-dependent protease with chaperone function
LGFLLSPKLRKQILLAFFRTALIFLVLTYLLQNDKLPFLKNLQFASQAGENPNNIGLPAPPVFQPPQVSPFLSYVLSLGIALLFIGLVMVANRWWAKQRQLQADELSLDDIALIARSSLDDISRGGDWENVIVNCYARMSQVASAKRGLHRHESMTPGEFASLLKNAGLPADAIQRLTHLFESVRYGKFKSTQKENDEAINCLTAILLYCGEIA